MIEENPGVGFIIIAKELANRWKNADPATKEMFEKKAVEIKDLKQKR